MKKLLLFLSIVLFSFVTTAQTAIHSIAYYSPNDSLSKNGIVFYKIDSMGGALGVEFEKDGFTYLVVGGGSLPNFSPDNREADNVFRKYIKAGTTYGFLYEYRLTISDANYIYGNPLQPTFGTYEDDPFLPGTTTLKSTDLQTEAQFFIDNIIKNKHSLPISISQFVFASIKKREGL